MTKMNTTMRFLVFIAIAIPSLLSAQYLPDIEMNYDCSDVHWQDGLVEVSDNYFAILLKNESSSFNLNFQATDQNELEFKVHEAVPICKSVCEDGILSLPDELQLITYSINSINQNGEFVFSSDLMIGVQPLPRPCVIFFRQEIYMTNLFIDFSNNDEWQDGNGLANVNCPSSFQTFSTTSNLPNRFNLNDGQENWFSAVLGEGQNNLSVKIESLFGFDRSCDKMSIDIKAYGPFEMCDHPCDLIFNGLDPVYEYQHEMALLSPFQIDLLTNQTINASSYFISIKVVGSCRWCDFEVEFDAENFTSTFFEASSSASDCIGCLPPASLSPNKKYILSTWVKEDGEMESDLDPIEISPFIESYESPNITFLFNENDPVNVQTLGPVFINSGNSNGIQCSKGPIVEGWQLMELEFTTPLIVQDFKIIFGRAENPVLYDDVRLYPADGSMKSYVYDSSTYRFVAELDERNYSTFYEYDEDGNLQRIKKETERGIVTIQESKYHNLKQE